MVYSVHMYVNSTKSGALCENFEEHYMHYMHLPLYRKCHNQYRQPSQLQTVCLPLHVGTFR